MTTKLTRIGPAMKAAVSVLDRSGGVLPNMCALADRVGPNGSRKYGYETVYRCIRAGLIVIDSDHPNRSRRGSGAVVLTDSGREAL